MHSSDQRFHGLGGAFYPEHRPEREWPDLVAKLAGAGLKFVRVGEFAWDKMEPEEGTYRFDWLDRAFALLDRHNIEVVLCTPTAVPPVWACEAYPDITQVDEQGRPFGFGMRRYTCPVSPNYRRLSEGVVSAMAEQYGDSPQIAAWQIDNEVGHPFCYCDACRASFQRWCRERFETVEAFNDAVFLHFWGQTVQRFDQIPMPTQCNHPGLWMLYYRFVSEATVACFGAQAEWLRRGGVSAPITTNMMGTWYGYDHEAMAGRLDTISTDYYGLGSSHLFGDIYTAGAFIHRFFRGMKPDRNMWFHEFQWARQGGSGHMPLPGQVRWCALSQVGLGADRIGFFRFDVSPAGAERDGYGLIGYHGQPGRVYDEVRTLATDLDTIADRLDATAPPPARVAVLYTWPNHCEFRRYPKHEAFGAPHGNGYTVHLSKHFGALWRAGVPCDVVHPGDDFSRYDALIVPACYILPEALGERLTRYAADGGTLVVTSFTGLADQFAKLHTTSVPGPLREACGVEAIDYGSAAIAPEPLRIVAKRDDLAMDPIGGVSWIDELRPVSEKAEVWAAFDHDYYGGVPALVRHPVGRGAAWTLGALLDDAGYGAFYKALAPHVGLEAEFDLPEGVYASRREGESTRLVFLGNATHEEQRVELGEGYRDAMTGEDVEGALRLGRWEVRVLEAGGR